MMMITNKRTKSLHAPGDAMRMQIVPSGKAYPVARIMQAVGDFIDNQNRQHTSMAAARRRVVSIPAPRLALYDWRE